MAHLYGDKRGASPEHPHQKALPLGESCLLSALPGKMQALPSPSWLSLQGQRLGADALGTSTDLSSSCWLFTGLKVSKKRHGRDGEAPER